MPKPKDTLERININTPCQADWDEMVGSDEVRFCKHCNLSVHNLSAMTRQEALRLVLSSKGKLCARYIRRPGGAIHTTDIVLPRLYSITRRASRIAAGAFSAALSISTSVVTAAPARSGLTATNPSQPAFVMKGLDSNPNNSPGASVVGIVKDANGAAIAGATVTLIHDATGAEYTSTTDDEGGFQFQTNEEGNFTLKIEASGFVSRETTSIVLGANDQQYFDETLEVSSEQGMGGAVSIAAPTDPLVFAVVVGDLAAIKEMLATGTDVNSVDEEYGTALSQAVSNGNREIVAVLINAGADVNKVSNGGHTALMSITGSTTSDIIWTLMDAGAKTDLKDEDGGTALHYAATNASPDALRALLNGGGSVDARDTEDQTALMIAANAGNSDNVLVLLKAGASVNLRDENGTTALGLALENDNDETVRVLLEFGATE